MPYIIIYPNSRILHMLCPMQRLRAEIPKSQLCYGGRMYSVMLWWSSVLTVMLGSSVLWGTSWGQWPPSRYLEPPFWAWLKVETNASVLVEHQPIKACITSITKVVCVHIVNCLIVPSNVCQVIEFSCVSHSKNASCPAYLACRFPKAVFMNAMCY